MDFATLINVAQKNTALACKEEKGNYYSTKFQAPKKETPKERKLSANIQKFLQKQQEEEEAKRRDEKMKLAELMSMRDTKAKNKIKKMLKVTKSANRSVLEDAQGDAPEQPDQPDEDDYGYVSQEAGQVYKKLMEKYKSTDDGSSKRVTSSRPQSKHDLSGTKDRVKAAIQREREEQNGPRKRIGATSSSTSAHSRPPIGAQSSTASTGTLRKRTNVYDPAEEKRLEEQRKRDERPKKAPNRGPMPSPMDFQSILKMAQQKQHEPLELPPVEQIVRKRSEPERLLTAKERREQEDRQRAQEDRDQRRADREKKPTSTVPIGRIPKNNGANPSGSDGSRRLTEPKASVSKPNGSTGASKSGASAIRPVSSSSQRPSANEEKSKLSSVATGSMKPRDHSLAVNGTNKSSAAALSTKSNRSSASTSAMVPNKARPVDVKSRQFPPDDVKTRPTVPYSQANAKSRQFPPADVRTRQFPPSDVKTRQFPPADVKSRKFPPEDVRTRQFPPADVRGNGGNQTRRPNSGSKRRVIDDDDSEYDSEMDDFIDEDEEEASDYSQHIKAIFGYDKSRYRHIDEDVDNMESSFAQQMKEEFISKKIGLMEDLEDMRQEAEEKKAKAMKRGGKRRKIESSDDDD